MCKLQVRGSLMPLEDTDMEEGSEGESGFNHGYNSKCYALGELRCNNVASLSYSESCQRLLISILESNLANTGSRLTLKVEH